MLLLEVSVLKNEIKYHPFEVLILHIMINMLKDDPFLFENQCSLKFQEGGLAKLN